jgi:DNA-binding response OmpR family regulator
MEMGGLEIMEPVKILMIEDNPGDARLIRDMLADAKSIQFVIDWRQTLNDGLQSLSENRYDAVLLDLGLPDSPDRSSSFTLTQTAAPNIPIVVLTGLDDETFDVTSAKKGARDFIVKGKIETETLVRTLRYALREVRQDIDFENREVMNLRQ